jgi:hypothetical protein
MAGEVINLNAFELVNDFQVGRVAWLQSSRLAGSGSKSTSGA